jgi:hypothetical protein
MSTKYSIIFFALFLSFGIKSQSPYEIDTFTIKYDTLTNFNSIALENLNSNQFYLQFDREQEFGFDFPFFNEIHSKAEVIDSDGAFYFGVPGLYNIFALDFDWHLCSEPETRAFSKHDYRYVTEKEGDKNVFKLEWHDVAICHNSWDNAVRPFNFQVWLWENGDIDVIFGKLNKSDTTIYKEGKGFFDQEGYPVGNVGIINSKNDYALFYAGLYDKPIILEGHPDSLFGDFNIKSLPHKGFVISFKKMTSSIDGPSDDWFDLPTLVSGSFNFPQEFKIEQVSIYDLMGRKVLTSNQHEVDISGLQNGMYIVTWSNGKIMGSHKFYKY